MTKRPPHPSGRPIRRHEVKSRPMWRIPDLEPATPRLRQDSNVEAIGFLANLETEEDEDADV